MRRTGIALCCIGLWLTVMGAFANTPATLDELLNQVRRNSAEEALENREREQRFLSEKRHQAQLLEQVRESLAAEQRRSDTLHQSFEQNQERIAALEAKLQARSGTLLELFGVVRQAAGDTEAILKDSLVSTQLPGRSQMLAQLAGNDSLPSIEALEGLWFALQQEMTESGKVVTYPAQVIDSDGSERERRVTRLGLFNVVSAGSFLRHLPESGKLQELPRQPAQRYREQASALQAATSGMQPMVVDPSRGAVLDLLMQTPDLLERVHQGKLVGYVIIAIGLIGLLIALERALRFSRVGRRIRRQLKNEIPDLGNPLGRVMAIYRDNPGLSPETLELKMDESILRDSSTLQRGLPSLKILAAIAPLLGLLGTVTGLIETFQSITLFGTGDPGLMAGGISQALVTTVLGLTAAIPLILFHSMLNSQSRRLFSILEEQSAGIIARQAEREERRGALA